MHIFAKFAAALAAMPLLAAAPARASALEDATQLRRLDIMLMVTGLRCRTGDDDFRTDFQAFEAAHLAELNTAARDLRAGYVATLGARGADRELDRISVTMANAYGNGHPWLGCHDLKQVTRDLAVAIGKEPLLAAADEILRGDGPRLAYRGE